MASSILMSSDEIPHCYPCKVIDDVTTDAVYLCKDCNHDLCENCRKHHRKTLITRAHTVIKLRHTQSGESEFQVSGRRHEERSEQIESKFDQSEDLPKRVQDMSLSPEISTTPRTSKAVNVYRTATQKSGLNVSIDSDDGPCKVNGLLMLQDRIIVCDIANSKLKVFDYVFLYEHVCDNRPYDIDKLDDTTVVVSLFDCTIRLLSVGRNSMTELLKINTELQCFGVCSFDGRIYCVLKSNPGDSQFSQIHVYTPDGKLKRRFEHLSDSKVECNDLMYITVNPQTGILYVTDWNQGVVALSTSGIVIAVMSTPLLKNLLGIAVDDLGQIYVCGVNSNNVIQMSADGQDAVNIVSKDNRCNTPICIQIYGNKMFLSCGHSDTVGVYELSCGRCSGKKSLLKTLKVFFK